MAVSPKNTMSRKANMPEVSRFFGIVIKMYYDEHNPPHFHAEYGSQTALVSIDPIRIIEGKLSKNAWRLVQEWARLHQHSLLINWENARKEQTIERIEGLE